VIDLNQVLTGIEKMLQRLIGEDIELTVQLDSSIGAVKADPGQLEQVILNLAVNARDAMPRGGRLTIETASVLLDENYADDHVEVSPGRHVMMAFSDTGVGMDKESVSRIFEPFFTTKAKGKGTGLGLSTVYGIIKQSGGHIFVYSEPGHGSTFKIYIPVHDQEVHRLDEMDSHQAPGRGTETILVVEDDDSVRRLTGQILGHFGYQVLEADSGDEALEICDRHSGPIHMLITDVVMPKISGRQVAEMVRQRLPEVKVVFISGYTDNAIAHHGVLDEGINFVSKPFSAESLARKVRQVLDRQD
jgi:CheY-like chemotaxis protein